jgi:hypothetical protein
MPIHLQAPDIDVIDAGGNEGVKVTLGRCAAAEVIAPAPIDIECPGPRINLAGTAANSALDRRERQQQAYGNAGRLGSVAQGRVALPEIRVGVATIRRCGCAARGGEEPDGAGD